MKQGLYVVSVKDWRESNNGTNGVIKKINSQIDVLNKFNCNCELLNLPLVTGNFFIKFLKMFYSNLYPSIDVSNIDYIYIRRFNHTCLAVLSFLAKVRQSKPSIKIILEIPTWPYDNEYKKIHTKVALLIDKIYRKRLCKYVDLITTYSNDKSVLGIPTLQLKNGIQCSSVTVSKWKNDPKSINLIAVANFSFWHGYDRLLEGLKNYYLNQKDVFVRIIFVGGGPELSRYKEYVKNYGLTKYVCFTGEQGGVKLDEYFDLADIGVCSLGGHRKGLSLSSELKSREYLAKGLPIISSMPIDIVSENFEFMMKVPENEDFINIDEVVHFYKKIIEKFDVESIRKKIRLFAEKECDINVVFKPVVDYIYQDEVR